MWLFSCYLAPATKDGLFPMWALLLVRLADELLHIFLSVLVLVDIRAAV